MMSIRAPSTGVWKKASEFAQASLRKDRHQTRPTSFTPAPHRRCLSSENGSRTAKNGNSVRSSSPPESRQKRQLDREFLISVLEFSPTKRDTRAYLQTYGGSPKQPTPKNDSIIAVTDSPRFIQGPETPTAEHYDEAPHVALVTLRNPQSWDDNVLDGVAKTLTQMRDLGLLSVLVLDCGNSSTELTSQQSDRVVKAIGRYGWPGARYIDSSMQTVEATARNGSSPITTGVQVGQEEGITAYLRSGYIVIVPTQAESAVTLEESPVEAEQVILALATFFSGLQINTQPHPTKSYGDVPAGTFKGALVERIIVIDPHGGTPASSRGDGARVFVNLAEEFERLRGALEKNTVADSARHLKNLKLVKSALAILPPTASAVITTPAEAGNLRVQQAEERPPSEFYVLGSVGTRSWQNPLIHNLLTDRPMYSSSLPLDKIKRATERVEPATSRMPTTTLAKKGLPLTIFPDPRVALWSPPKPGAPRLRLTDTCIHLPRLIHLINDSFSRQLDPEHYLRRLEDSLAGIIIAGEYEGGAILTWERPFGLSEEEAYEQGRLIPYLDKFAVLKKSQGAGGVADIVFNAMVRDCFPNGLCWRSRKNNPVNKWYFERSVGARKLPDSNWSMFWTDPEALQNEQLMRDYEDVCRNVVPSWADGKQAD